MSKKKSILKKSANKSAKSVSKKKKWVCPQADLIKEILDAHYMAIKQAKRYSKERKEESNISNFVSFEGIGIF